MHPDHLTLPDSSPRRIVLGYLLLGVLWIIFSDLLLMQWIPQPLVATLSIAKGGAFVAITALLLYHFIGRQLAKMAQLTAESRKNEEWLRRLEDNLPDSYLYRYRYEPDGTLRFLHISAGVESLHGISREEVLRDAGTLTRQIDAEELSALTAARMISQQEMTDLRMVLPVTRSDGEKRWFLFSSRPCRGEDGQVFGDGVATDISGRRLAEESMQEQKRFTENLIENSAVATFVLNAQHQVLLWNKACEELTGIPAATMIGTNQQWQAFYAHERPCLADIVLDPGSDRLPGLYDSSSKSNLIPNGLHAEGWFENLHDRDRYIMFDAAPVYDSKGTLLAAIETLQDITAHKKAEEELKLQSAALHAAANAIVITDRNGTIEWVNPAFTLLTGYASSEAIGKNPRELVKSDIHNSAFYKQLWETLLAGNVWRGEIMNRHKDGTLYPEGQTITPVKDARGEITHFISIKRDLTERHQLELQLQHAQKMESIGTFAGGIAHDFNNILTAIIGYGTIALLKMAADSPQRLYVQNMLEASDRAAHLTKDLLLFSRKQGVVRKPVDLNMIVAKAEKFLSRIIGEDIACKTILQEAPILIFADDYQLEQVLMNLATNARDAMPHGGALTVTTETLLLTEEFVSVHGFGKPGAYALISVTDNGCGMDEIMRLRIFEPFFTTKEVGKGTGLGLAVTYGIIKQHDGYINVYSEPSSGTTFRIYLPLISAGAEGEDRAQAKEVSVGGTETILIAEDDKSVRAMTMNLLTEFGYTVIEAVNGADAVKKFTAYRDPVDLLLFDLIMPKMNGKEALDEIRKIQPGIKVIFSSGYAPDTIRQKTSLADGVHLITKPAPPTELLRKVRQVLDEVKRLP